MTTLPAEPVKPEIHVRPAQ
ncbi:hypothetical protein D030_1494, partial [Vibrio parahaemolyticus AQ3810]